MITYTTRWLLAALLSVSFWSAAASSEDGRWQGFVDNAVEAFVDGDYVEAGRWFDAAVKRAESFGPQDPRLGVFRRCRGARATTLLKTPNRPFLTKSDGRP